MLLALFLGAITELLSLHGTSQLFSGKEST